MSATAAAAAAAGADSKGTDKENDRTAAPLNPNIRANGGGAQPAGSGGQSKAAAVVAPAKSRGATMAASAPGASSVDASVATAERPAAADKAAAGAAAAGNAEAIDRKAGGRDGNHRKEKKAAASGRPKQRCSVRDCATVWTALQCVQCEVPMCEWHRKECKHLKGSGGGGGEDDPADRSGEEGDGREDDGQQGATVSAKRTFMREEARRSADRRRKA